jgi:hypothetical protein
LNRAERKRQEREGNKRVSGWIEHPSPKQLKRGDGWFSEFDRVFRDKNSQFVVMIRDVKTEWGNVQHAAIKSASDNDIPWRDKQRIKNELFGTERTAIEVFPKESRLVDAANLYHIWVLPVGLELPFGL